MADARCLNPNPRESCFLAWGCGRAGLVRLVAGFLLLPSAGLFAADTSSFRGGPAHTGVYDGPGSAGQKTVKWSFKAEGQLIASPAVTADAVIVASTSGHVYAVDRATGKQKWNADIKTRVTSTPAVANGIVYFAAFDGNFYAGDAATGALKWKFKTEGERRFAAKHLHGMQPDTETMPDPWDCWLSSPAIADGVVYFGSGDGNVYALDDATGALKWKFKTGDVVHASPAVADGMVFIGSWDSWFYALDAKTGAVRWKFKTGEDAALHNQQGIQSSAAVSDGMVYFGCRDSHLYALDEKTGEKRWAFDTKGSWVLASPAVSHGKVFFSTSDSGMMYAADAKTGAVDYAVGFNGWPVYSSPAISGDMLYVGSTEGKLAAVHAASGRIVWSFETDGMKQNAGQNGRAIKSYFSVFSSNFYDDIVAGYNELLTVGPILSSPVVADGTIYLTGVDGSLYALQ